MTSSSKRTAFRLVIVSPDDPGITFDVDPTISLQDLMETVVCKHWLNKVVRPGDGGIRDHLWRMHRGKPNERPLHPYTIHKARLNGWDEEQQDIHEWLEQREREAIAAEENDNDGSEDSDEEAREAAYREERRRIEANIPQEEFEAFEEAHGQWLDDSMQYDDGLPKETMLEEVASESPGFTLHVIYDYSRHESMFEIRFDSFQEVTTSLPFILPTVAEKRARTFEPYQPPAGSPNIDKIYPLANQIMFASGVAKWVCPFSTRPMCAGFVEGGHAYDSDIVFLTEPSFSGLHEALVAVDQAMMHYPASHKRVSRMMFPVQMDGEAEERFQRMEQYYQEFLEYKKSNKNKKLGESFDQLSENVQHQLMCPDLRAVLRLSQGDVDKYQDVLDDVFPLCAKAYHKGLWATYRRDTVVLGQGNDKDDDRGVPREILAQVTQPNLKSLHDFLCVCEALFAEIDASNKFRSLRTSLQKEPTMFEGATKIST